MTRLNLGALWHEIASGLPNGSSISVGGPYGDERRYVASIITPTHISCDGDPACSLLDCWRGRAATPEVALDLAGLAFHRGQADVDEAEMLA